MPHSDQPEIQSPCIGVCTMSEATGLCLGCYRTIDEIRAWWDMSAQQRSEVMDSLEERQAANLNFD
ncbi:MAG TPA: DUF1289 domain-containing protein [Methylophilaceae bacterium]|nr:DUF1289 domain-containing protein [Methylophilaceae bacterium]